MCKNVIFGPKKRPKTTLKCIKFSKKSNFGAFEALFFTSMCEKNCKKIDLQLFFCFPQFFLVLGQKVKNVKNVILENCQKNVMCRLSKNVQKPKLKNVKNVKKREKT